jgi:hypothetical protein
MVAPQHRQPARLFSVEVEADEFNNFTKKTICIYGHFWLPTSLLLGKKIQPGRKCQDLSGKAE